MYEYHQEEAIMDSHTKYSIEDDTIDSLSKTLGISKNEILRESLSSFLDKKLKEIKLKIFEIKSKYNVSSTLEFEKLYQKGLLEEKDSWKDFQRLDHLEFKKVQIEKFLKGIN